MVNIEKLLFSNDIQNTMVGIDILLNNPDVFDTYTEKLNACGEIFGIVDINENNLLKLVSEFTTVIIDDNMGSIKKLHILKNIKTIILNSDKIKRLPGWLSNFDNLESLIFNKTNITKLSIKELNTISRLKKLKRILVDF